MSRALEILADIKRQNERVGVHIERATSALGKALDLLGALDASAIEAQRAETVKQGSVVDESAGPKDDAQPSGSPTPILPKKERTK